MNIFSIVSSSRCAVSGSGKIAMHVVEKLVAVGALPITVSGNSPNIGKVINCKFTVHLLYDDCYRIPSV